MDATHTVVPHIAAYWPEPPDIPVITSSSLIAWSMFSEPQVNQVTNDVRVLAESIFMVLCLPISSVLQPHYPASLVAANRRTSAAAQVMRIRARPHGCLSSSAARQPLGQLPRCAQYKPSRPLLNALTPARLSPVWVACTHSNTESSTSPRTGQCTCNCRRKYWTLAWLGWGWLASEVLSRAQARCRWHGVGGHPREADDGDPTRHRLPRCPGDSVEFHAMEGERDASTERCSCSFR